jgi:hypothetical protein
MMATSLDVAGRVVAVACAAASNFVTVSNFDPLVVSPNNLFLMTFSQIGVTDTGTFLAMLIHQVPQFQTQLTGMTLSSGTQIGLVVNFVAALIDQV